MRAFRRFIKAHHRFGHIAPADAFVQQHVLRAEIGEAPGLFESDPFKAVFDIKEPPERSKP
jgi:hypothetical protein